MNKIYSRPRIKIPKILLLKKVRKRNLNFTGSIKTKKTIKVFLIIIIAFFTVKTVLNAVLPIFDNLCENKAKSIASIVANEQATIVIKDHSYDELFKIEKDNNGNIAMIKSNVVPINEIISDVANKIQKEINNKGRENVKIAMR